MVELQNEDKLAEIIDKKIGDEIDGSVISDVFDGYKFKITGGFDKDGFAMKNGILAQGKKKVLLTKGCSLFRYRKGYHRSGIRVRRLVRGCIISNDIKNVHLKIIKKGAKPIAGLTEEKDAQPKRLGPKRATRILKAFGLTAVYAEKKKNKDERKNLRFMITNFAPKRTVKTKNGKEYVKRPKIQRLIKTIDVFYAKKPRVKETFWKRQLPRGSSICHFLRVITTLLNGSSPSECVVT